MAVIMETPKPTLPPRYRPPKSLPYRVKNGDSLSSLAQRLGMTAKALLQFNYNTDHPPFINYYLKNNVGCKIPTPDGKNYTFLNANPGVIYYPAVNPVLLFAPKQGEGPAIYMGGNKLHGLMIGDDPDPKKPDHIKVSATFSLGIAFNPTLLDPTPFVYRQYIRGQNRVLDDAGHWHDIPTRVPSATYGVMRDWEKDNFLEDGELVETSTGVMEIRKYGYREAPGVPMDKYLPNQQGHQYTMYDMPGFSFPKTNLRDPNVPGPPSGRVPRAVEVEYYFRGVILQIENLVPVHKWGEMLWDFKGKWRIKVRFPLETEPY